MEIEKSSKVIKCMHEEDEDVDLDDIDYKFECKLLFDTFSNNKRLSIDFDNVVDYLDRFNKLHRNGVFTNFKPPLVQEYFCKQLNFLLIIDFILTFFRVDDAKFDVKKINTRFIFDFFVRLGEFYNFMNYLDVDECIVNYLKYMVILYAFQLDRDIIEDKYYYFIEILDDFFRNEIMLQVFSDINYKKFGSLSKKINDYEKIFDKEIKDYDNRLCYNGDVYLYLDDIFSMDLYTGVDYNCKVLIKNKTIEVLNPNPPPVLNHNESDDDSDDDNHGYWSDDDWRTPTWTPTIKKQVPVIEKDDANYEEYRKLFILRNYQTTKIKYDCIRNEIKTMCMPLQLKKYDTFEPTNCSFEILKVKTILGCVLDYSGILKNDYVPIFGLACDYGHIEIVKALVHKKDGDIGSNNFEKAQASPNRDIPRYLQECKTKYKKLEEIFAKYKDVKYYEPKIQFN
jgi:hypothetical protein